MHAKAVEPCFRVCFFFVGCNGEILSCGCGLNDVGLCKDVELAGKYEM